MKAGVCKNCGTKLALAPNASQEEKEAYDSGMCLRLYISVMSVESPPPCQGVANARSQDAR